MEKMEIISIEQSLDSASTIIQDLFARVDKNHLFTLVKGGDLEVIRQYTYVVQQMAILAANAREKARDCEAECEQKSAELKEYSRMKEVIYAEEELQVTAFNDSEKEIIRLQGDINRLQLLIIKRRNDIAEFKNEIMRMNQSLKNKTEELLNWCWVPIYNISLLVDTWGDAANYEEREKALITDIRNTEKTLDEKIKELEKQKQEVIDHKEHSSTAGRQISYYEQKISEVIRLINQTSSEWKKWEMMQTLYNRAAINFENADVCDSVIQAFEQIIKLHKKVIDIERESKIPDKKSLPLLRRMRYHGNTLYPGQELLMGDYIASIDGRFVAAMQYDGRFVLFNAEQELWSVPTTGDSFEFIGDGQEIRLGEWRRRRGDAAVLILQSDGNLVLYNENHQPLWATDTWQYGNMRTSKLPISHMNFSGSYAIISQESLCFDICGGSQEDCAIAILYRYRGAENQRFILHTDEESGACSIRASHSGKVLGACGASRSESAKIDQYPDQGSDSQRWYILPGRGEGTVRIVNVMSELCMDVTGGDFCLSTPIQQYWENGTAAQSFILAPA